MRSGGQARTCSSSAGNGLSADLSSTRRYTPCSQRGYPEMRRPILVWLSPVLVVAISACATVVDPAYAPEAGGAAGIGGEGGDPNAGAGGEDASGGTTSDGSGGMT